MPSDYLNAKLNKRRNWQAALDANQKRVEVDLNEVERVLDIARRTPGLAHYEDELHQLSIFFRSITEHYAAKDPEGLDGLLMFWEQYRAAVIQRYSGVTPAELRAADKVVGSIFKEFLKGVPKKNHAYSQSAAPLVYGGDGGIYGYYTHPAGWSRPFAIINLPHAAFDNVWQWLALAHETGHDLYATVDGLPSELERALDRAMRDAVKDKRIKIPGVNLDLSEYGLDYRIRYSGGALLGKIWRTWANESQADVVGLLSCGGAAAAALQQIIEFETYDEWLLYIDEKDKLCNAPEEHPTPYVRNAFNIAALRQIDKAHGDFADELQERFEALRPKDTDCVTWCIDWLIDVAALPVDELIKSAELAAEVIVKHKLEALGNKSYSDIISFSGKDQKIVDEMVDPLLEGDSTFCQAKERQPRHALAATMLAFEKNRRKADVINSTFRHFV